MEIINSLYEVVSNLDLYFASIVEIYGLWVYAFLFIIIFFETGFVITPFLPGDSIIFTAGTLAALKIFDLMVLFIIMSLAAILGDTLNYWIGKTVGRRAFKSKSRFLNRKHLAKTEHFYQKHGGRTVIIARFIPIVRTFAPFVAGVGVMEYKRFLLFNIVGGTLWVSLFLILGNYFGNIPLVKNNFELAILGIVIISLTPLLIEKVRSH